jgi:preprotein translocase subunit SecA
MIDQHWREHLYEMDYLREGINLRAMGQKDPLSEWQHEGFDMFEAMMGQIQDAFVAYASHLQVAIEEAPREPDTRGLRYSSPDDSASGAAAMRATAASMAAEDRVGDLDTAFDDAVDGEIMASGGGLDPNVSQQPVRVDKTPGRNEPCFCGSGKKYKLCHGR